MTESTRGGGFITGSKAKSEDAETGDSGICGQILTGLSWFVVICTMPFSLFVCFKVVQEYERAVIFRLGRLVSGGAKGPGELGGRLIIFSPCFQARSLSHTNYTEDEIDKRSGTRLFIRNPEGSFENLSSTTIQKRL
ncbi:hypothetical protein GE061_004705 [Apolygus lucorum]|uniref:Uncharacterized protein n=1 Tax=Apolygus lucorum TaxID=248454 RepID=A0A8S9X014_APOLU|nr:hypothetical protein GE061_004705 [Apolygus lucorum]